MVDLDVEQGRPSREDNKHRCRIVKAKNGKIRMSLIQDYLEGRTDFNTGLLEAISKRLSAPSMFYYLRFQIFLIICYVRPPQSN